MDQQEEKMDFKALRAKFQDEEIFLKQPRTKPALPEKPKVVPPPQSPTHYLPAGARPSLLSTINQTLDGRTSLTPRVVFKDDKKESKRPLLQTKKDWSEGKLKKGKDKSAKGSREKLDEDSPEQKQKKENGKDKMLPAKETTGDLVPATPPPKAASAKKGFLGLKKLTKRDSVEVLADPILDTPSSDVLGPPPLIPVPPDIGEAPAALETSPPVALLPNIPTVPDSSDAGEISQPLAIPAAPTFTPPPAFIPDNPANAPESETPLETETPALPLDRPDSQSKTSPVPTPPPSTAVSDPHSLASTSSPSPAEPQAAAEAVEISPPSSPASRISPLSALERAEDMIQGKRAPPCDQRIVSALEKARRKNNSPVASYATLPREELPPAPQSPTSSLPELPPTDYEALYALPKPAQVNGLDRREASPTLEGITEERPDPGMLVVPPPPPKKPLPDPESLGAAPEKPDRPPSVDLSQFVPPPLEVNEIHHPPAPPQFSEFEDGASDANSPELPLSDWGSGEVPVPDEQDGQNVPEFYGNGIISPEAEVYASHQIPSLPESSISTSQESPLQTGLQAQVHNGLYESTENVYEDVSTSKKKGKTDGGKKRKGPPKNPYAEAQETNEEKSRTGRFGRADKRAAAEGLEEKELKKKEKQRLEKEKKELKEKQEKEKKEQKEREKKENEMKKKFKITGQEDTLYEAKVMVTTKGRKNDLPVQSGDAISIVRTTNCPKGKWLARDSSNNYGYVAVDHVELDIKEMLELGKRAANNHKNAINAVEVDATSTGSRASNHYPHSTGSFTDDSEEWTGDDEEPLSPPPGSADIPLSIGHSRTLSMPDMGMKDLSVNHQHSHSDISTDNSNVQARHEALQKLATFFYSPKPAESAASGSEPQTSPAVVALEEVHPPQDGSAEGDFDASDMLILPPPELYADSTEE